MLDSKVGPLNWIPIEASKATKYVAAKVLESLFARCFDTATVFDSDHNFHGSLCINAGAQYVY